MRPDPLSEAASRRHELTRAKAIQALRELDRAGTPVTFAGVAQAALLTELADVSAAQEAQSSRGRSQGCPEDPDRQAAAALSPT
jgi:hypothetical protein